MRLRRRPLLVLSWVAFAASPAFASESESEEPPAVLFNHFYVVTDAATYAAAQASSFMTRELAGFEKRTTVRNDQTYTGIYFYGRHTYFELFEPGAQGPVGSSGLAFGVEKTGASAAVRKLWKEAIGGADGGPVTRRTETAEVPWFEMSFAQRGRPSPTNTSVLKVWLMEYDRDFLGRWYPDLTPARTITRADVLDRYVAKVGQSDRRDKQLLNDVVGLTLALPDEDRESLLAQLRVVGYTVRDDEDTVLCEGPDLRIRLVDATGSLSGVIVAEFSLQKKVERAEHRLGSALLTLEGERARLQFGAAAEAK